MKATRNKSSRAGVSPKQSPKNRRSSSRTKPATASKVNRSSGDNNKLHQKQSPNQLKRWLGHGFAVAYRYMLIPVRNFKDLRERRPHRSFQLTRRRDSYRSLSIPGYAAFSFESLRIFLGHKKLFAAAVAVFVLISLVLGGVGSMSNYNQASEQLQDADASLPAVARVSILALSVLSTGPTSESQKVYVAIVVIMTWLTVVWLLREILAGNKPRFRDGLYNAGSPIAATLVVIGIFLLQLFPAGIVALIYSSIYSAGLIQGGLGSFLFFGIAVSVAVLTLYWVTSTFFALIIITLPGMYPLRAMQLASDIVLGRRLRLLLRLVWLLIGLALVWALVLGLAVLIDQAARPSVPWLELIPVLPVTIVVMTIASTVWASGYVYLLYRKVVADDTA